MRFLKQYLSNHFLGLTTMAALLAVWQALSAAGLISTFLFPPPSDLFTALYDVATNGFPDGIVMSTHIAITLQRIALGFMGAILLGVPLGLAVGYIRSLDRLVYPIVTFGRSIAAISVLPLFIAWFGIGELSKVMLIGFGAFWIIVTYTTSSVKLIDPVLIRAALSMDMTTRAIFLQVILPAALPRIFTGLRVALIACFTIIVAAEMIATVHGLGSLIMEARNSFRTDITMVGMLVIGFLGLGASKLLDLLEQKLLPWKYGSESQ